MKYRPDIDGLRAVAIIAVVLFHAKVPGFSGGFVGVDVFFVISGFLITSLIVKAQQDGRFSLLQFYDRRIRRIFPALVTVWAACIVVGGFVFLPAELSSFGASLVASAVFLSNLYFFKHTDYFSGPAHERPLLHTWSLSIEEQFYVVWPLLLVFVLARMSPLARRLALAGAITTSLIAAELQARVDAVSAFFLPQYRAWELFIGCAVALELPRLEVGRRAAGALSVAGLVLIVQSIVKLDGASLFPGLNALAPCLGTAFLILGGRHHQPIVNRVLSAKPFVVTGLLSYSLYLWHWPALAFVTYYDGRQPRPAVTCAVLLGSVALSYLSWRFVETPFRRHGSARRAVLVGVVTIGLFAAAGLFLRLGGEQRWWVPHVVVELDRAARERNPFRADCGQVKNAQRNHERCRFGSPKTAGFDVVLFGDSHGDHWAPAVAEAAATVEVGGRQITQTGCPPLFDVDRLDNGRLRERCLPFPATLERFLDEHPGVSVVIIAARWDIYSGSGHLAGEDGVTVHLLDDQSKEANARSTSQVLSRKLDATLRRLLERDLRVLLVGQVPPLGRVAHACVARSISGGGTGRECGVPSADARERLSFSNDLLTTLADKYPGVEVFLPSDVLCDAELCAPVLNDVYLYLDDDHLNREGSQAMAPYLLPVIERVLMAPRPSP